MIIEKIKEIVSIEKGGVHIVASNAAFRALGWLGKEQEGRPYKENHDHYFCFKVTLDGEMDDPLKVYLYVKERQNLVPMMDLLWEEFVDIQLLITETEILRALLGEPEA